MLRASFSDDHIILWITVLVLMLVNWGIEAKKWKILVERIQPVSLFTSFKAVLSGVSLNLFLPNGIGDYAGRIVYMDEGNRLRSISLTIVGSMAQLIVTLSCGMLGLIHLTGTSWQNTPVFQGLSFYWIHGIIFITGIGVILLLIVYFKMNWFTQMFEKIPFVSKYRYLVENLENISHQDLTRILLYSFLRFVVFILQYLCLFELFQVDVPPVDAAYTTCVMFLILAILPTIPVADLGIRGEAGLHLFGIFTSNQLGIIAVTAGIWVVNLILPAIAGSLFIVGIKFFKNR